MSKPLHLYVSSNRDGILFCPEIETIVHVPVVDDTFRGPDSKRRVFVAGDPNIHSLSPDQLNSIIELAFRDPKIREGRSKARFYEYDPGIDSYRRVLTHVWGN